MNFVKIIRVAKVLEKAKNLNPKSDMEKKRSNKLKKKSTKKHFKSIVDETKIEKFNNINSSIFPKKFKRNNSLSPPGTPSRKGIKNLNKIIKFSTKKIVNLNLQSQLNIKNSTKLNLVIKSKFQHVGDLQNSKSINKDNDSNINLIISKDENSSFSSISSGADNYQEKKDDNIDLENNLMKIREYFTDENDDKFLKSKKFEVRSNVNDFGFQNPLKKEMNEFLENNAIDLDELILDKSLIVVYDNFNKKNSDNIKCNKPRSTISIRKPRSSREKFKIINNLMNKKTFISSDDNYKKYIKDDNHFEAVSFNNFLRNSRLNLSKIPPKNKLAYTNILVSNKKEGKNKKIIELNNIYRQNINEHEKHDENFETKKHSNKKKVFGLILKSKQDFDLNSLNDNEKIKEKNEFKDDSLNNTKSFDIFNINKEPLIARIDTKSVVLEKHIFERENFKNIYRPGIKNLISEDSDNEDEDENNGLEKILTSKITNKLVILIISLLMIFPIFDLEYVIPYLYAPIQQGKLHTYCLKLIDFSTIKALENPIYLLSLNRAYNLCINYSLNGSLKNENNSEPYFYSINFTNYEAHINLTIKYSNLTDYRHFIPTQIYVHKYYQNLLDSKRDGFDYISGKYYASVNSTITFSYNSFSTNFLDSILYVLKIPFVAGILIIGAHVFSNDINNFVIIPLDKIIARVNILVTKTDTWTEEIEFNMDENGLKDIKSAYKNALLLIDSKASLFSNNRGNESNIDKKLNFIKNSDTSQIEKKIIMLINLISLSVGKPSIIKFKL